ncbi:MAG TPA: hypothetical protein VGD43_25140, partial [Micromonospora sp.]
MTVVAVWTPGAEGQAALLRATEEARLRRTGLLVLGPAPAEALAALTAVAGEVPITTETPHDDDGR